MAKSKKLLEGYRMKKRSECNCLCHEEGSGMLHIQPCCVPDEIAYEDLIGKSESFAKYNLEIYGCDYRICHPNSMVTMDFVEGRVTVRIDESGRVSEVSIERQST